MLSDTVVIEGEVSLVSQIDGDPSLLSEVDGDPNVVIAEGGGIVPSGTIEITENGTYNVRDYASADVDVQGGITPTGTKQISIATNGVTTEDVTNYADVEVTTAVPASAVDTGTKSISTNGTHDVVGYASASVAVPASAVDSGTKSITSNGTHDVIGYASASVAVPNSYSASDEGKVVSNGALVAQTSDTVTANDTYDTTLINSLTVNVSGSSGYTIDDIIDRSPITGAVSYEGSTTNLSVGCLANTGITSFSSSKITNAGNFAFYSCKSLVTVDLPNLVIGYTSSGGSLFAECTNLQTVHIPKYKRSGGNTFQNCKKLQMIVVPNIDYQFTSYWANGCTELTTVDVGPNIGSNFAQGNAFSSSGINTLILRRTAGVIAAGNNVFSNSPLAANGSGGDIYVPSALLSTYQSATNWSSLNATWHAIEGSYYETHYADGTVIA